MSSRFSEVAGAAVAIAGAVNAEVTATASTGLRRNKAKILSMIDGCSCAGFAADDGTATTGAGSGAGCTVGRSGGSMPFTAASGRGATASVIAAAFSVTSGTLTNS
jgi:hypothetical protein